jgi:membrane protease YdiL (CAAX protease family)
LQLSDFSHDSPTAIAPPTPPASLDADPHIHGGSNLHYIYTFLLAALVVFLSFAGSDQQGAIAQKRGHIFFYLVTMGGEFFLLALTYLGIRFSRMRFREVIGGRWNTVEDFLLDVAIAIGFWILLLGVVAGVAVALHLNQPGTVDQGRKTIQAIGPKNGAELALFILMSTVAGFVEEIVYRGYFQRQFSSLLRNGWIGMIAAAVLFGLSHGYEGGRRMFIIFVMGALFGTLAILRKSLRPGMMSHAIFDSVAGIGLMMYDKLQKSGAIK